MSACRKVVMTAVGVGRAVVVIPVAALLLAIAFRQYHRHQGTFPSLDQC